MSGQAYWTDSNGQQYANGNYSQSYYSYQDQGSPAGSSSSGSSSGMGGTGDIYQCLYEGCPRYFTRATDLNRHYQTVHAQADQQRIDCEYKWCGRTGDRGFTRRDHYTDHLREVHQVQIEKSRRGPTRAAPKGYYGS